MDNLVINFVDGTPITLKLVRTEGDTKVYEWDHVSFRHVTAINPAAKVEIEAVDGQFTKATYFCANPLCGQPSHDFTQSSLKLLADSNSPATLENGALAFTGHWVQVNQRAVEVARLLGMGG